MNLNPFPIKHLTLFCLSSVLLTGACSFDRNRGFVDGQPPSPEDALADGTEVDLTVGETDLLDLSEQPVADILPIQDTTDLIELTDTAVPDDTEDSNDLATDLLGDFDAQELSPTDVAETLDEVVEPDIFVEDLALEIADDPSFDSPPDAEEEFVCPELPCTAGSGVCEAEGVYNCAESPDDIICSATPGEPEEGICDEEDDDCDGTIDEGRLLDSTFPFNVVGDLDEVYTAVDVESLRIDRDIFSFIHMLNEDDEGFGRLVRFTEDGTGLILSRDLEICQLGNPQITASLNLIIVGCDADELLNIYFYDASTMTRLETVSFVETDTSDDWPVREFHNLDIGLTIKPLAIGDGLVEASIIYFSYQWTTGANSMSLVVRYEINDSEDDAISWVEVPESSSPTIALSSNISDEDTVLLFAYYSTSDRYTVEYLRSDNFTPLSFGYATLPNFACDEQYATESVWSVPGRDAVISVSGIRGLDEDCLSWSKMSMLLSSDGSETVSLLQSQESSRAEVAVAPIQNHGAWLTMVPSGGWQFSYLEEMETISRQSDDIERTGFNDILSTSDYFGVLTTNADILRWDLFGCD
jgi:hypothetical protein